MRYSADTSAFINAWRRYYPPDSFPAYWDRIDNLIRTGDLRATEEVLHELEKKDDEIVDWAKRRPELFIEIDDATQDSVKEILASHPRLLDTRKNRSGADPFVIALARLNGTPVLTDEPRSNSINRPKIPDVCLAYDIRSVSILGLIQENGWVFRS